MKRLLFILSIVFTVLCLTGSGYVLSSAGAVSPGYSVIPMLFALICLQGYRTLKARERDRR